VAAEEQYTKMYESMRYKLGCSEKKLLEARLDIERLQARVEELQPLVRSLPVVVPVISVAHHLFLGQPVGRGPFQAAAQFAAPGRCQ